MGTEFPIPISNPFGYAEDSQIENHEQIQRLKELFLIIRLQIQRLKEENERLHARIAEMDAKKNEETKSKSQRIETKSNDANPRASLMAMIANKKKNNERGGNSALLASIRGGKNDDNKPSTTPRRGPSALMASIRGDKDNQNKPSTNHRRGPSALMASIRGGKSAENKSDIPKRRGPSALMASIRGGKVDANNLNETPKTQKKKVVKAKKVEPEIKYNKAEITPNKKMKALHWKRKIFDFEQSGNNETIWNGMNEVDYLNVTEFEHLFSVNQRAKKKENKRKSVQKDDDKITILPKMRYQNLCILLKSLPALDKIKDCFLSVDEKVLTTEKLQMILKKFPTPDEIASIKNYEKENENEKFEWDKPERFCLIMSSIPNISRRLNLWIFVNNFDASFDALCESLRIYNIACDELYKNEKITKLFSVILTFGNYMNAGTKTKERADGFDIEILPKLQTVKSSKNRGLTLLDYIVQCSYSNDSSMDSLIEQFENVRLCTKLMKLSEIKSGCLTLMNRFNSAKKTMDTSFDGNFLQFVKVFVENNEEKVGELKLSLDEATKNYTKTVSFYDAKKNHKQLNQSKDFMVIFADFIRLYDRKMNEYIGKNV